MRRPRILSPAIISTPVLVPALLLVLTAALRWVNVAAAPARIDDEGTYVAEAYAVVHWGELAHYTYWYDHPPLGWLQLAAWSLVGADAGANAVVAARHLMVVVAVIAAALLWVLARRVGLSLWAAAGALAVFALSPLATALGRTVYLDNIAVAWLLAAFVLLCSPRRHLAAIFGAASCLGIAVLTKETMLLMLPSALWLAWTRTAPATRRYALAVFGAVFVILLSAYVLLAALRGELLPGPGHVSLWDGVGFQLWQRDPGGGIADPYSLKRHTIDGWIARDPALPVLAAPAAGAGLFVPRLRPFAVGLAILAVVVARPGYLPVPLFITAVPLIALILPGAFEVGLRQLRRQTQRPAAGEPRRPAQWLANTAVASGALLAAIVLSLWLPTLVATARSNDDASMQAAESWIKTNVPHSDRLIVDDTFWVDLIRDGRDRRNVVWAYKVDSDPEVQAWSPNGWKDYDWVVSTPSVRANLPKHGVLTDAIAAGKPAAVFGSAGGRVELLRLGWKRDDDTPHAGSVGAQLADKLAGTADPEALTELQSVAVDRRALATLAVLAATQPARLRDIPAVDGEDGAGTARRELIFSATGPEAQRVARFFADQPGAFAAESVSVGPQTVRVRFALWPTEIGLAAAFAPTGKGPATLRIADLRPQPRREQLDLVRVDGTAAGSVSLDASAPLSTYRSLPAGIYIATTHSADSPPVVRGVLTMNAGVAYTLTLFGGHVAGDTDTALAPDGDTSAPHGAGSVRLIDAVPTGGPVTLALNSARTGASSILADGVGYGLISGYAAVPGGQYTAVVTTNGHESRQPVDVPAGQCSTLIVTQGPGGVLLKAVPDLSRPSPLDAPTLAIPLDSGPPPPPQPAATAGKPGSPAVPVALAVGVLLGIGAVTAAAIIRRPT